MPLAPPVTNAVFPWNLVMAATIYGGRVEFREILRKRRMHRAFLPDPLPVDQIERIAAVIKRAPSGGFSQGGSIVVVTDDEKRAAIARAFGDEHYSPGGRNFIADAPVHMVISANEALYHARYNEADKLAAGGGVEITWPVPYWFVDAGALMMLVLAAAIDEGLASAFIGHPDQKRIFDELLGLPEDVVPIGLALIGKPGEVPPVGSRLKERQRAPEALVHWQQW
jgi:FMN reductase [NAD(P)H]